MSTLVNLHKTPATALAQFQRLQAALPLVVAQARCGLAGHVMIDFGAARGKDAVTGADQYDWHLLVYMCEWDLYKNNSRVLWRRESDNTLADAVLGQLVGERMTAFDRDDTDDCFILHFSGGFSLNIDPDFYGYDAKDDMFMLFEYGRDDCLSFSPKKRFYPAA